MSTTFSLDDIKAAADRKYGSTLIDLGDGQEPVELLNALRLPKGQRKKLNAALKELESIRDTSDDEEGAEDDLTAMSDIVGKVVVTVARNTAQGRRLLDACGDDLGLLMSIFESYNSETELGEASPSQD